MDLTHLDTRKGAEQGFELALTHPETGARLGATMLLLGADAEEYQRQVRAFQKKRTQQFLRQRKYTLSPEEAEEEAIELLVVATLGWKDVVVDGKPLEFNHDNARMLYTRFPWLREQVQEAVTDRANFLPRSASA